MFAKLPRPDLFKTNDDLFRNTMEAIIQKYSSLSDPGVDICLNTMTYRTGRGSVSINSSDGEREFEVLKGRIQAESTIVDLDDQESDTVESEVDEEEFRISFRKEAEKSHSGPSLQASVDNLSHSFLSQPEEEDEELERTLSSHGGTLVDVYPSMLSQIGQACRRQHVKDTARAVLEKYRKRRQQTPNSSFSIRHAGQTDLNRSIRTSENFLNFLKNKPKPSPFKPSGSESAACFFSPRREADESGEGHQSPSAHLKPGAKDFSLSPSNPDQTYDLQSESTTFQAFPSSSVTSSPRGAWCSPSKASGDHVQRRMSSEKTSQQHSHSTDFTLQSSLSSDPSNPDQTCNLRPEESTFQSGDHVPRWMSSSSRSFHPSAISSNSESEKTSQIYSHSTDFTLQSSLRSGPSYPDQTYNLQPEESTFQAPPSSSVTRSPRRAWCSPSKAAGDQVPRRMSSSSRSFPPSAFLSQEKKYEMKSHIYDLDLSDENHEQTYNLQPEESTFKSSPSSLVTRSPRRVWCSPSKAAGDQVLRRMSPSSRPFYQSAFLSQEKKSEKASQIYSCGSHPSNPDQTYNLHPEKSTFKHSPSSSVTHSPRRVWCSPSKASGDLHVLRRMSPSSRPFHPSAFLSQENKYEMKSPIYAHGSHTSNPDQTYNLQPEESTYQAPPSSSVTRSPRRVWCSPSKAAGDQVLRRMSLSSRPFHPSAFLSQENKYEMKSHIYAHGSHPSNLDQTYNLQPEESTFKSSPSSLVTRSPRRVWCSPSKAAGDHVLRRMSPSSRPFHPSAFLSQENKPEKTSQIYLLKRLRSSSGPPPTGQQNDAEFRKLYHHFICRGTSSPSCHLCEGKSSRSKISSNMSGLDLTPMRPKLKKRLRPLESEESQRIKRFRESRSPPKRLLSEEQSRSRGFLLQCPSPHFLRGAKSLRKIRQFNLKKYQSQVASVGSDSPRSVYPSTANINTFSLGKFSLSPSFSRRRLLYDPCQ